MPNKVTRFMESDTAFWIAIGVNALAIVLNLLGGGFVWVVINAMCIVILLTLRYAV